MIMSLERCEGSWLTLIHVTWWVVRWHRGGRFGAMWRWRWVFVMMFGCDCSVGWRWGVVVMKVWGEK